MINLSSIKLTIEECDSIKESEHTYYEDIQELLYNNGYSYSEISNLTKVVCDDKQLQLDLNNMIKEIK